MDSNQMIPESDYTSNDQHPEDENMSTDELLNYIQQQLIGCARDYPSIEKLILENFPLIPCVMRYMIH